MTATWLIIITIAGCLVVPLVIIYFHSVGPSLKEHPNIPHFIIGMIPGITHSMPVTDFIYKILV